VFPQKENAAQTSDVTFRFCNNRCNNTICRRCDVLQFANVCDLQHSVKRVEKARV